MTIQEICLKNLTNEQYETVKDDSQHILCLACAGSGKSRTLAFKIAYLIAKGESPIQSLHLRLRRKLRIL